MTPPRVSVVIPVKDGERYLEELLAALAVQGEPLEVLVIDSGSHDHSLEIARAAGVEVLEIAPEDYGHGRTRNLGVQRTAGELICFLTQDATPVEGWLGAYREAFALGDGEAYGVGAAYGPHLARRGASPMIARELSEFFAGFSAEGRPVVQQRGDPTFLSNVNACYARECVASIGFRDVPYSEDQAFGADLFDRGWVKVFHPGAAVMHSHDYSTSEFLRRYFDEYRGLRQTLGHVEPFALRSTLRDVAHLVRGDVRWMREHDYAIGERLRWSGRSTVHHGGRRVSSALGSRAASLPAAAARRLSLEGTVTAAGALQAPRVPCLTPVTSTRSHGDYWAIDRFFREGAAPLLDPIPGMAQKASLHLAFVVPPFGIGSGGHGTIFRLLHLLEQRGHTCSIWVHDPFGERANEWPAVMRRLVVEHFSPVAAPLHKGFDAWRGADVVIATGWQTVYPAMLLPGVRARAYMINDHEPEFYPTSVESIWAEETYRLGLYGICASPWLRDKYIKQYGGSAGCFELGVDLDIYTPRPIERRTDTVVFYCRPTTPRRAFALGAMALRELRERRPDLRVVSFGTRDPVAMPLSHEHAGIVSPAELSWLYSQATVGLCMSMTNYSLIPKEMLACGLPCVELAHPSTEGVFGHDGPVSLAPFRHMAVADVMEELMSDDELWRRRSQAGIEFVADRSWESVTGVVEREIRQALALREGGEDHLAAPHRDLERSPDRARARLTVRWGRARIVETIASHRVTQALFERLRDEDVAAVMASADEHERQRLAGSEGSYRQMLTLAFGVHRRVPSVLERTGLSPAAPPEDVHAMARGSDAAGGGYWYADLIAEEAALAGRDIVELGAALDFGCSSGRVVRVLACAYPDVHWYGCDPNPAAIRWAAQELGGVDYFVSPQDPPLDLGGGTLDLIFAISVWSHYGAGSALRWLAEMHRVLKPGGLLLLTTHGPIAVDYYRRNGQRPVDQLDEIERALSVEGFWFRDEFGRKGDWGVKHPEWGTAFLSPDWLLAALGDAWELMRFAPGKIEGNQDVYVLGRC